MVKDDKATDAETFPTISKGTLTITGASLASASIALSATEEGKFVVRDVEFRDESNTPISLRDFYRRFIYVETQEINRQFVSGGHMAADKIRKLENDNAVLLDMFNKQTAEMNQLRNDMGALIKELEAKIADIPTSTPTW
jgi:hypothetical protein